MDPAIGYEVILTGIPLWLVQEYVEELGGRASADGWLDGTAWRVHLTQVEDYQIGSLRVGQVYLQLLGESAEVVAQMRRALEKKLLRAGG